MREVVALAAQRSEVLGVARRFHIRRGRKCRCGIGGRSLARRWRESAGRCHCSRPSGRGPLRTPLTRGIAQGPGRILHRSRRSPPRRPPAPLLGWPEGMTRMEDANRSAMPSPLESPRTAAFTIVSCNYLAHARVLMRSVREFCPGVLRIVLLADRLESRFDPALEDFEVLSTRDLHLP